MTKYKFKKNGGWQDLVQDVNVNGSSVFDGETASIQLKTVNGQSLSGTGDIPFYNTYKFTGVYNAYTLYIPQQNLDYIRANKPAMLEITMSIDNETIEILMEYSGTSTANVLRYSTLSPLTGISFLLYVLEINPNETALSGCSFVITPYDFKYVDYSSNQSLTSAQKQIARNNIDAQEVLTSGTTIKTINTIDLLGSGDISVQAVIDANNLLDADLVDDTSSTNKFVTSSDITTWNGKSTVSGADDGTNWTSITINGTTKSIPSGGGTSTDVQINGTSIVVNDVANILTETAYNASTNKIATVSDLPDISTKQDTLVSGTNIKTINSTSILGSGDIDTKSLAVTALSGTLITLTDNSINTLTPTGNTTFTLPTVTDTTIFHQILVQLNLSTVYTIDLGTTAYFGGTAPDLSQAGNYNLIYEYDNAMAEWVVGAVNKE